MSSQDPKRFDGFAFFGRVNEERKSRDVTWAALGRMTGVSAPTIKRFAKTETTEADGVLALVRWLGCSLEDFSVTNRRLRNDTLVIPDTPDTMLRTDTAALYAALVEHSETSGQSFKEMALEIGCTGEQLKRMSKGGRTNIHRFLQILDYLDANFMQFCRLTNW